MKRSVPCRPSSPGACYRARRPFSRFYAAWAILITVLLVVFPGLAGAQTYQNTQYSFTTRSGGAIISAAQVSASAGLGDLTGVTFSANTVSITNNYLFGGGLAGAAVSQGAGTASVGMISGTFDSNTTRARTAIEGGGLVGARAGGTGSAMIGDNAASFQGNTVQTTFGYLQGGGLVGARSYAGNATVGTISGNFGTAGSGNAVTLEASLQGGGLVGAKASAGDATVSGISRTATFYGNTVAAGVGANGEKYLLGGGLVGASSNLGTARVGDSFGTFGGNTVTAGSYLYGGGLVGARSSSGNAVVGTVSGSFGSPGNENTTSGNTVRAGTWLYGGGLVGAMTDFGTATVHAIASEATFQGNTVTTGAGGSGNQQLFGGGLVGAYSYGNTANVGDVAGTFGGTETRAGNTITVGTSLLGGGLVGAATYTGQGTASVGTASAVITGNTVNIGSDLYGGGMIGAWSQTRAAAFGGLDGAILSSNTVTAGTTAAAHTIGGGIIGVSGLNSALTVNDSILTGNHYTVTAAAGAAAGGMIYIGTDRDSAGNAVLLTASGGKTTEISGNIYTVNGVSAANSFHFGRSWNPLASAVSNSLSDAFLTVRPEAEGTIHLLDPITVDMNAGRYFTMTIEAGAGSFTWGGLNRLSVTDGGTATVTFATGATTLGRDFSLKAENSTVLHVAFSAGSTVVMEITGRDADRALFDYTGAAGGSTFAVASGATLAASGLPSRDSLTPETSRSPMVFTLASGISAADITTAISNFTVDTTGSVPATLAQNGSDLQYVVDYTAANTTLTWTSSDDGTTWDELGKANWTGTLGDQAVTKFMTGDTVIFDDTAPGKAVRVADGGVWVAGMTVSNSAGNDYVFSGGEIVSGTGAFTKTGDGAVTFANAVKFASAGVSGGTVRIGNGNATGSMTIAGDANFSNAVIDLGALNSTTLTSAGTITVGGTASFIGTTVIVDASGATEGTWTLITCASVDPASTITVTASNLDTNAFTASYLLEGTALTYTIAVISAPQPPTGPLIWNGKAAASAWNTDDANKNWSVGAGAIPASFKTGETVLFTDAAESKDVVVHADGVAVADMTVSTSAGNDYVFTGGSITSTTGTLEKTGDGAVTFANAVEFASASVSGGTLRISATGSMTIAGDANFSNAVIDLGALNSTTLTSAGTITVGGTASFIGTTVIVDASGATEGAYTLIDYATLVSETGVTVTAANLGDNRRGDYYFNPDTTRLVYEIIVDNTQLVWNGTAAASTWNVEKTNTNWTTGSADTYFMAGDAVIFDDTAASQTVTLADTMTVSDMTVSGGNYAFTGGGISATSTALAGSTQKLILSGGSADFTGITATNTFPGGIDISGGKLIVSNAAQLGTTLSGVTFTGTVPPAVSAAITGLKTAITNNTGIETAQAALEQAIQDAQANGTLGTLAFADSTLLDAGGTASQRLTVAGNAASIEVVNGAVLSLQGNAFVDENHGGGAIYVSSGGLFAKTGEGEIVFANNMATGTYSSGGALDNPGGTVTFAGPATFIENVANGTSSHGGAIYNRWYSTGTGVLTFSGPTSFIGNKTNYGNGGAIYNAPYATVTLSGPVIFKDNTAGSQGGAIYNSATVKFFGPATFTGNTASYGGAIDNEYGGTVTFSGPAIFKDNSASAEGGGIDNYSSGRVTFSDAATFENNMATSKGGGISNDSATIEFKGASAFTGNTAETYGGAIENSGSSATVDFLGPATFTNNTANSAGGAIYNTDGGTVNLRPTNATDTILFSGNKAYSLPNSIHMEQSGTLNVGGAGIIDMRDPMAGNADDGATITISKSGSSIWYLGGANDLAADSASNGKTGFTVSDGTLHLYRAGEVDNPGYSDGKVDTGTISLAGTGSSFTLGSGATLSLGGTGHSISVPNGTITLEAGSTLKFNMTGAVAQGNIGETTNLTLSAGTLQVGTVPTDTVNVNVTYTTLADGTYTVISAGAFDFAGKFSGTINGQMPGGMGGPNTRYGSADFDTTPADSPLKLIVSGVDAVRTATWTNNAAADGVWNETSANWTLSQTEGTTDARVFKNGDHVVFGGTGAGTVNINNGVYGDITIGSMTVKNDYTFTGGSITGTGALTKTDTGAVTFANAVKFASASVSGGSLKIADTGKLSVTGNASFANTTIDLGLLTSASTITVGGTASFTNTIVKLDLTGATAGTYTLITYDALGSASTITVTADLSGTGLTGTYGWIGTALTYTLSNTPVGGGYSPLLAVNGWMVNGTADTPASDDETSTVTNETRTWTGAENGNWNTTAANWSGDGSLFVAGDAASFDATASTTTITVASEGVAVSAMTVSGGTYAFEGGAIASTDETTLDNPTQQLMVTGSKTMASFGTLLNFAGGIAVTDGATLGGNFTATGGITVGAGSVISPGNSINTITTDRITFETGSVYRVEVDPENTASSDRIVVTGIATLAGTVQHTGLSETAARLYGPTGTWTILSAGEIVGTFDAVTSNFAFLDASLSYEENEVRLQLSRNDLPFAKFAATSNQREVATGLDTVGQTGTGAAMGAYNTVLAMDANAYLPFVFDMLSGEIHAGLSGRLMETDRRFGELQRTRLSGKSVGLNTMEMTSDTVLWFSVDRQKSTADKTDNTGEGEFSTWGASLGVDKKVSDWTLGAAFRYGDGEYKVNDRSSEAEIDSFSLALYAGRPLGGDFNLKLGAGYGLHQVDSKRQVAFMTQQLKGDYDVHTVQAFGEVGWLKTFADFSLEPYAGFSWNFSRNESFSETGGSAALRADAEENDNFASNLGVRGRYWLADEIVIGASLDYQHLFGSTTPESRFAFDGGQGFTIEGAPMDRNSIGAGVDVGLKMEDFLFIKAGYLGRFGEDTDSHAGYVNVEISF